MAIEGIRIVGVVGSGLMGSGIALNFALAGYETIMSDLDEGALAGAMKRIDTVLSMFNEEGLTDQAEAAAAVARIETTTDLDTLAKSSDFITEAIVERLEDKQELFRHLDQVCPPHTVIVSNTSSLKLSDIGEGVGRQENLGLTHYFVPPHIVPGVEIAKGPGTSDATFELLYDLMKAIRKVPIRVLKERSGYLINTINDALAWEAGRLWAEGVASAEDIELGIKSTMGFRMPYYGPFGHYDYSGTWRWPPDVLDKKLVPPDSIPARQDAERSYKERLIEGPFFMDPDHM
ncbi:MAG: 3-hydroxyacyl-CoA dehydrogenase family protein, partial [Boseongicola sp.]|nr:3-hydroxyacyl-CoA dehydrogenase family protein [Boseongicola sp.]